MATQLKTHVPSATKVATITENNDQNNLIGRPNGYVSAAVLYDSGTNCDVSGLGVDCGATIEVWPTEQAATARAAYIQGILSGGGMGSEWDFVKGGALLRVTGTLKPSAAGLYGANFGGRQINQGVPSSPTTVSAEPTAPQADAALRAAVQAYSDAYLSGNGRAAYALLSKRCQKMDTPEGFSALVDQAKNLYGNPLPMTSFKAHIASGMARVTYTYTITAINQTDQPWTLEAGGWRDDNC